MVVAEGPSGTGHKALGLGHVWGAVGVNMHLEMRRARDQVSGSTRVIQMHMCE